MISAAPPKNANCNDSIWLVIRELFCYSSSVTGSGRWLVDGVADNDSAAGAGRVWVATPLAQRRCRSTQ
jgi:hypothetical protein